MARKDVENKLRAVNHPPVRGRFDVSLLNRGKVAVENNQRRFVRGGFRTNFVQLAAADQRGGIGSFAQLEDGADNIGPGAARQLDQLGEIFAALLARGHARKTGRTLPTHAHK